MEALRCARNSINVTQIYVSTIYFILKQGYMLRLEVGHLQAPTTFSLPDVLPTNRITNRKNKLSITIVVAKKKNSVTRNVSVLL